jgi:hypothetical protein
LFGPTPLPDAPWTVEELVKDEGAADLLQSVWLVAPHPSDLYGRSPSCRTQSKLPSEEVGTKAVTVLGVAGALSLAGGASGATVGPAGDTLTENTAPVITLGEEEISDVSLATFYVFDNENAGAHRSGLQLAKKRSHGSSRGRPVNRGCGCAVACGGCASGGGPDGM